MHRHRKEGYILEIDKTVEFILSLAWLLSKIVIFFQINNFFFVLTHEQKKLKTKKFTDT